MNAMVAMRGITKRFPGVLANDGVDFQVRPGEVHTLLGENGAGKTTLMNILYGMYRPDAGEIYVRGERVEIHSPRDAIAHGIGMVHQHFMLVPPFTVAENIVLGLPSRREPFLESEGEVARRIDDLSQRYGLRVNPHEHVWELSVGEQQRVEIFKALYRGAALLILDEPTAVLTPPEAADLFKILGYLVEQGKSVVFISHKLDEVMAVSHRVTVLRDGRVVGTTLTSETNQRELAQMMVGREVFLQLDKAPSQRGPVALKLEGVCARDDKGLPALREVTLRLHEGEILGIAGVDGNGQSELEEVIGGLRPLTAGWLQILGQDMTNRSRRQLLDLGVAHVPSDRKRMGMLGGFTVAENAILESFDRPPFVRRGLLDWKRIKAEAQRMVDDFAVRPAQVDIPAGNLSGGNAQKLVFARELSGRPRMLLAAQPTRGLDIAATEYVRRCLLAQRDQGVAVLLISTELEEILSLSDRIAVIYEGEIMGVVDGADVDVNELGLMMAGVRSPERPGLDT